LFDNIDHLYGNKSGGTQNASATPPPPPGGDMMGGDMGGGMPPPPPGPEPGGPAGVTPESFNKDNLQILIENQDLLSESSIIDLSKGKNSLGDIEVELAKLLGD
jgi:hypothetical protein